MFDLLVLFTGAAWSRFGNVRSRWNARPAADASKPINIDYPNCKRASCHLYIYHRTIGFGCRAQRRWRRSDDLVLCVDNDPPQIFCTSMRRSRLISTNQLCVYVVKQLSHFLSIRLTEMTAFYPLLLNY